MRWNELCMKDRADVMKLFIDRGIYDLDTIKGEYNRFAEGGGIHIDPSKRGTFTAAASRHNMGVQEFASKVLANKDDYSAAMVKKANFARNASKWHAYGGNLYDGTTESSQQMQTGRDYWTQLANRPTWLDTFIAPVNGGQLSEVVVKPTDDESWLFSLGRYARNSRKPLADSHSRKVVANYLSRFDNESAKDYNARISRLADTLDIRGVQFIKNNVESGKLKNRAHYDSKSNTAYIDDMQDIFAEIAHPWQDAMGNNSMDDEFKKGNYDPDIDSRGGTRYAYPDTFEGETHGFFQPSITEWVETGKIGRSLPLLNEDLSNEKIVPNDNMEVLDSAASWNKQAIDRRLLANPHQLPLTKRIQYSFWDYPLLKKKAYGGNIFDGDTEPTQQMQQGYIRQRPEGTYFYDVEGQPEIDVTPLNTSLSSNPADWSFTDALGKIYSPHRDTVQGTGELREGNQEGPILSAVNNYLRELNWRAKNDPASIALQGKYTMPTIAATGLLPWLGEAAAATNVAGVPLTTLADAGLTAGFGAHGLNHWLNEGINGWGDAAMTALEVAPLGRLVKPVANEAVLAVENYRYPFGRPQVPEGYITVKPQVRTRVGDVEIDNPNLLYHLDRGDSVGAFSNQGAYVEDGKLLPGIAKEGEIPYSWWNLGRPYATSVNGQPMTRLMTTTKDTPGMLHIRSQNYPIGQWNGKRGLVTNAEYVNPEGVNISESTYTLDPDYGWRRVFAEETPVADWPMGKTTPQITAENAASITPEQWTAAQDAAIAKGDVAEAQRLRDLHFGTYQNGDMVDVNGNPIHVYHGSPEENITEFYKPNDPRLPAPKGIDFKATGEEGIYTSPRKGYAANYMADLGGRYRIPLTKEQKALLKAGKTREEIGLPSIPQGRIYDLYSNTKLVPEDLEIDFNPFTLSTEEANLIKSKGYSGYDIPGKKHPEHVVLEPNQLKSADAVTYDVNGVRIPLGERDNFNINDIRYGLLPFGIGLTGYGILGRDR